VEDRDEEGKFFRRVKSLKHEDDLSTFTQGGDSNLNPNGTLNVGVFVVELDLFKGIMN